MSRNAVRVLFFISFIRTEYEATDTRRQGGCADVDLPGRPGGDVGHLRAVAAAREHLARELWSLDRHLRT